MTRSATRKLLALAVFVSITAISYSQPGKPEPVEAGSTARKETKPFTILTSGKQITIKSSKDIKSIMVWTASGHRILEQKAVNAASYTFEITINEKIFFVMVQLLDGKLFTEKIGLR